MTDDLRAKIAAAILRTKVGRCQLHSYEADILADAVIRELGADCCFYRYACPHCGDFWFDKSERMQRFALLHGKAHRD